MYSVHLPTVRQITVYAREIYSSLAHYIPDDE